MSAVCPHGGTCITRSICEARSAAQAAETLSPTSDEETVTGFFLRIERDGKWCNVDVGRMSDDELRVHFDKVEDVARLRHWVVGLATWIRVNCVNGPGRV